MSTRKTFRPDAHQTKSLVRAGKVSADDARRASKALGLEVSYIRDGVIYAESPDGTRQRVGDVVHKNGSVAVKGGPKMAKAQGQRVSRNSQQAQEKVVGVFKGAVLRAK